MSAKEKKKISNLIILISTFIMIIILFYFKYISNKPIYATDEQISIPALINVSNAKPIDIDEIIIKNTKQNGNREEIYEKQEELEYITKYRNNSNLYVGTTQISQEGRNGIQTITMKKTFDKNGNIIKEEQVSAVVTKSSLDKIIDIGTKIYVKPENKESPNYNSENSNLSFDIALNKPSNFSLEEFKNILTDDKDKNKIFEQNAEYFYYIEEQYQINGIFVAAIGIHESAWGTSKIAKNKFNLFGYGAYDSNPYNGAYIFTSYSESIDLLARVLTKYYLNPSGTKIYDGQVASGKYYSGNTLTAVNKKYATDKNWANSVYKHMKYLYEKI